MDHHMKKILLSSVALLGLTAGAFAADLPSRRVAPAPYVAVPVFTWTGFYVGVNAGYGFSDNDRNNGS
jgi:outer membrane immunogenic protein